MGNCYEKLKKMTEAIKCYEHADRHDHSDGTGALAKLAKLHEQTDRDASAAYYERIVHQAEGTDPEGVGEALIYLAKYCQAQGQLDKAAEYCRQTNHLGDSTAKEQAAAILRAIHSSMDLRRQES